MTKENKRGDILISVKWIPSELHEYLKQTAKEKNITETAIIVDALKLHRMRGIRTDRILSNLIKEEDGNRESDTKFLQ